MSDLVGNPEDRFSRVAAHITFLSLQFVAELRKRRKSELNCYLIFENARKLLLKEDMPLEPLVDFMIENVSTKKKKKKRKCKHTNKQTKIKTAYFHTKTTFK